MNQGAAILYLHVVSVSQEERGFYITRWDSPAAEFSVQGKWKSPALISLVKLE
jgi:hypothetical protein